MAALAALGLSGVLFVVSLSLPALLFAGREPLSGANVLATGWLGLLAAQFGWYANLLYLAVIVLTILRRYGKAFWFSIAAVCVALHSLAAKDYYFNEGQGTPIAGLGSAFWFWLAALAVPAIGNARAALRRQSPPSSP